MKYKDLIDQMSLEEKASLTSGIDFWKTQEIKRLQIPDIILSDGPHGVRKQEGQADHLGLNASVPATCFPTAATVSNSWDIELAEKIGEALGQEAKELDVNVLLGPGCNMKRNPRCGRNFEYFSEDPYLAGKLSANYIKGIQSNGVSACVKHFAVNNQEERRMSIDTIVDERTLREIYLTAFEIAVIEGKTKSIMSGYNKLNGEYTNEHQHLLVDILRNEWKFDGVIVTDWGGENDRVKGLQCTNELQMPSDLGESDAQIVQAVEDGILSVDILDQSVDRLLDLVFSTKEATINASKNIDKESHHELARKVSEESTVLLKNEDHILPLQVGQKVALIGDFADVPRYQGAGSSIVLPTILETTIEEIKKTKLDYIGFEKGFNRFGKDNKKELDKAVNLSKKADVVIYYMGLDEVKEEEGLDRSHLSIAKNQIDVLKAIAKVNPNIVVVLSLGSVVEVPWLEYTKALLHGYLSGQAGASALMNIITGKVNPSGKLAETYPLSYQDVSSNFPGKEVSIEYREGLYIGYRYYDTANIPVQFPFGYGLSYTNFTYRDLKIQENQVTLTIENTGTVSGREIAQLYVSKKSIDIFRPNKELKGFTKVFLKAGESKEVIIPLDDKAFRYYNIKTKEWEIEDGQYEILVGTNCMDIQLHGSTTVKGTSNILPYEEIKADIPHYFNGQIMNIGLEEFEKLLGEKVPNPKWDRTKPLDYNDTLSQMQYAKGWIARFAYFLIKLSYKMFEKLGKGKIVNRYEMLILHLPFRGICRMSCGACSMEMVDGILVAVNGNFLKGMWHLIKASKKRKNYEKFRNSRKRG